MASSLCSQASVSFLAFLLARGDQLMSPMLSPPLYSPYTHLSEWQWYTLEIGEEGGHISITMHQLGGSWGMRPPPPPPMKFSYSEVASEATFGPNLNCYYSDENIFAALVYTALNSLRCWLSPGISLVPRAPVSLILTHLANIVTV